MNYEDHEVGRVGRVGHVGQTNAEPSFPYSLDQFTADIQKVEPRFFDTYLLAPFMLWFAYSSKTAMGRWPRRVLFTSGIYMLYRNYTRYQQAYRELHARFIEDQPNKILVTPEAEVS